MTENEIINKRLAILEARQTITTAFLYALGQQAPNKKQLEAQFLTHCEHMLAHLLSTGISDSWIASAESARDMLIQSVHQDNP